MKPKRVKSVLNKLTKISDIIVIGESLENLDGIESRLINNPECYEHPYRTWLTEMAFEITAIIKAPDPKPQLNGYIIAQHIVAGS